jgi:hypothetical protein
MVIEDHNHTRRLECLAGGSAEPGFVKKPAEARHFAYVEAVGSRGI